MSSSINQSKEDFKKMDNVSSSIKFIKNLAIITLTILLVIILGSLVVFAGKVSQSNILPTDIHCFPYTNSIPTIKEIFVNINDHWVQGKHLSEKIKFPYTSNSSNFILDFLRKMRLSPNAFGLENFVVSVLEGLFAFNYSAYNSLYYGLNYLPEILVLLLGPPITVLFTVILSLIDLFYLGYLWMSNLSWFFQQNENKSGTGSPSWQPIGLEQPLNYLLSLFLAFIFFILFFVGLLTFLPILTYVSLIICIISILCMTAVTSTNEKYNLLNCMKDSLKFHKRGIMVILAISILLLTFQHFGIVLTLICFAIILLIYFKIIPISIFTSSIPTNLSELVSNSQASKKCDYEKPNTAKSTSSSTNKSEKPKIGGFFPKFPQIFPSLNVVDTYNTSLPAIPYPTIKMEKLQLPNIKLPEEVEIKFPDIKIPGLKQEIEPTGSATPDITTPINTPTPNITTPIKAPPTVITTPNSISNTVAKSTSVTTNEITTPSTSTVGGANTKNLSNIIKKLNKLNNILKKN
jgi:hypothetical protein